MKIGAQSASKEIISVPVVAQKNLSFFNLKREETSLKI